MSAKARVHKECRIRAYMDVLEVISSAYDELSVERSKYYAERKKEEDRFINGVYHGKFIGESRGLLNAIDKVKDLIVDEAFREDESHE